MSALVVLEHVKDLDRTCTIEEDVILDLCAEEASMAGFQPGEEVTVRDLLYGALLPSGAECCETLAGLVGGTTEAFVAEWTIPAFGIPPGSSIRSTSVLCGTWP